MLKGLMAALRAGVAVGLKIVLEPIEQSRVSHPKQVNPLSIINISKFFQTVNK